MRLRKTITQLFEFLNKFDLRLLDITSKMYRTYIISLLALFITGTSFIQAQGKDIITGVFSNT